MQRPMYPAKTPPLHHPVPQKPVQVPVMHSPPPPPSSSNSYNSPYDNPSYSQPNTRGIPGGNLHPQSAAYPSWAPQNMNGNFFSDPAAQMGFSVANAAMSRGTDMAEKNLNRYISALKPYFAVTNTYVLRKLRILLFPFTHTPWFRTSTTRPSTTPGGPLEYSYLPPSEDVNAPDHYIPLMSFVTYILFNSLLTGISGNFHPEQLAQTATTAFVIVIFELAVLKMGSYLLNISGGEGQFLDLLGYSGYKFFGAILMILIGEVTGMNSWIAWAVFMYFFAANAFFLLRSLKYVLLPSENGQDGRDVYTNSSSAGVPRGQRRKRRTWFLFFYSYVVQFISALILTSNVGKGSSTK
ncbi:YIF1-domain-containing protein [Morchella snyderi]|nr:YIF1-domain-containing protein [Morchella snyderi]